MRELVEIVWREKKDDFVLIRFYSLNKILNYKSLKTYSVKNSKN